MYEEAQTMVSENVPNEKSDFKTILEELRKESCFGLENAELLTQLANSVKTIDTKPLNSDVKTKEPTCLIDFLWNEIYIIRRNNEKTNEALMHLFRVTGV